MQYDHILMYFTTNIKFNIKTHPFELRITNGNLRFASVKHLVKFMLYIEKVFQFNHLINSL